MVLRICNIPILQGSTQLNFREAGQLIKKYFFFMATLTLFMWWIIAGFLANILSLVGCGSRVKYFLFFLSHFFVCFLKFVPVDKCKIIYKQYYLIWKKYLYKKPRKKLNEKIQKLIQPLDWPLFVKISAKPRSKFNVISAHRSVMRRW